MRHLRFLALLAVLGFLLPGTTRAADYTILPVARLGDKIGDVQIRLVDGDFEVGTLNDNGQLSFVTENAVGGEVLFLLSNGALAPLIIGGQDAPGGKWPRDVGVFSPVSMNQSGDLGFAADVTVGGENSIGTFLWDSRTKQFTSIVRKGIAEFFRDEFERGGNWLTAINNRREMAFTVTVLVAAGKSLSGDFFRDQQGRLFPIALPDQTLPEGGEILDACNPHINDAPVVVFLVRRKIDGVKQWSAYQWERGFISPVLTVGTEIPGLGKVSSVLEAWVNNKDRSILLAVNTGPAGTSTPFSLVRWINGSVAPVVVPGRDMPGGGKLKTIQDFGISAPNDANQHAFLAQLQDNSTGAYMLNPDGTLSLILKSGVVSPLGLITNVGQGTGGSTGISLNNKGQVALTLRIGTGVDMVALLAPPAP